MGPILALIALKGLSPEIAETSRFLQAHGMGIDATGKYREASIAPSGFRFLAKEPERVHGWALPDGRFVTREGLTVPTLSLGPESDPAKDVEADLKNSAISGREDADWALRACVLFAAGRQDLAEQIVALLPKQRDLKILAAPGRFLELLYDQALSAHMTADDRQALGAEATILSEVKAYEEKGVSTAFLSPVYLLVEDTKRRLQQGRKSPTDDVQAAIADLENIYARQYSLPGSVEFSSSPTVQKLIALGDRAVEPLFECVEKDGRLTRSVSIRFFDRPPRRPEPVRIAAYVALEELLGIPVFDSARGRYYETSTLSAYWNRVKGKPAAERWFDILADDEAGAGRWLDAASRLFAVDRPARWGAPTQRIGREPVPAAMEILRNRQGPSLADLLSRRSRSFMTSKTHEVLGLRFALLDARWEGEKALPLLRETTRQAMREGVDTGFESVRQLANGVEMRSALHDEEVWTEYRRWIPRQTIDAEAGTLLMPLVRHQDAPGMKDLARYVYLSPASRYNLVRLYSSEPSRERGMTLICGGLSLAPVKEAAGKILADQREIGKIGAGADGRMIVPGNVYLGSQSADKDPRRPAPNVRVPFRLCDHLATVLASLEGAPSFRPYWTVEQKDQAIVEMLRFVKGFNRPPLD